jgi:hypothetical protein
VEKPVETVIEWQPLYDYRARAFCTLTGKHIYNFYFSKALDMVSVDILAACRCANHAGLYSSTPSVHGTHYHYITLEGARQAVQPAHYSPFPAFRKLCRWAIKTHGAQFHEMNKDWLDPRCYTASALRTQTLADGTRPANLDQFIDALGGFVKVITDDRADVPPSEFQYKGQNILCLIWITPWAIRAYKAASYVQLDCSFAPTHPYCYCVPHAIIKNAGVPLGFIMAPHESAFTYTAFMEELWGLMEGMTFTKLPVLSDEHPGLTSFCKLHALLHFLCHCHLIRKWGAGSTAAMIVAQVLRILTQALCDRIRSQMIKNLPQLVALKLLKQKTADKLKQWLEDFCDGMWERIVLGVARCSNIIERFHGIVRQAIREAGVRLLHLRLHVLKAVIHKRYDDADTAWIRQVQTALKSLKDKGYKQRDVCNDPECHAHSEMMCTRLGLPSFPCAHTWQKYKIQAPDRANFKTQGDPEDLTRVRTPDGAPIVETRSQVLERVRNRLSPDGGRLSGEKKEEFERVEHALNPPEARREVQIETIVVEWNDEKGPTTLVQEEWSQMEWYPVARHIVSGVYALRDRIARLPRLDKLAVAAAIFGHVAQQLVPLQFPNDQQGRNAEDELMAQWTAEWWRWAATDKNLPVGGLVAARLVRKPEEPDFIPEEDPIIRLAPD